jgi:hypothetical protein
MFDTLVKLEVNIFATALVTCIREMSSSILGRHIDYLYYDRGAT